MEELIYLQVLDFLDQLDVLLGQAGLVGGDVHDGAVQLLDLDVKFVDGDLQALDMLDADQALLGHALDLGQQLVNFGLELCLFLVAPGISLDLVSCRGSKPACLL